MDKEEQKQNLINIMKADEELGLYEEASKTNIERLPFPELVKEFAEHYEKAHRVKKMYSEEEVKAILFHRESHYIQTKNHLHIDEWFEQFKK